MDLLTKRECEDLYNALIFNVLQKGIFCSVKDAE